MQISFISNIHKVRNSNKNGRQDKIRFNNLNSDVFVKSVSFGNTPEDKSFVAFDKWAKKNDFASNARNIVTDERNFKGYDTEGAVYEIPNCENWIIKQPKYTTLQPRQVSATEYLEVEDVTPQINMGQKIASLWIPISNHTTSHFYVHKKQDGGQLGAKKIFMKSVTAFSSKVYLESLSKVANLPQESFNTLVNNVKSISEKGYQMNGAEVSNFSVDLSSKSVNFVGATANNPEKISQHTEVLYALLGGDFTEKFNLSHRPDDEKESSKIYSEIIIDKYLKAMSSVGAKFARTEHHKPVFNLLKSKGII